MSDCFLKLANMKTEASSVLNELKEIYPNGAIDIEEDLLLASWDIQLGP